MRAHLRLRDQRCFGFYLWLFGVILVGSSYLNNGGPGGGAAEMVDLFLVGLGLVIAGLLLISASVATTVLASRRAGMTLIETPIFSWSALVTSISMLLTLPVLAGAIIYVAVDHAYERATFGATEGVNAWIGWAFASPQIFIVAIPTLGVLAQIVATMTRGKQPLRAGLFCWCWVDVDGGEWWGHPVVAHRQLFGQHRRCSQIVDPICVI